MQKFLRQLTTILRQNDVFHTVESADSISSVNTPIIDTYTVFLFEEKKQRKTRKTKNETDKPNEQMLTVEAMPMIQIKHAPRLYTLTITINQMQVYGFNDFKYKYVSPGFSGTQPPQTQQALDNILDICIKKSDQIHLKQLKHVEQVLKNSKIR